MRSTGLKKNLVLNKPLEDRKTMVERNHPKINIKRQVFLLSINRTSVYRKPMKSQESEENLRIMHEIDAIYTNKPYFGYRRITVKLQEKGYTVNRKRVRRLMLLMGIHVLYPKPNLSKRIHSKYVHPYLLRGLDISRLNQVWGVDITYIRMGKGFMYLFTIIDWYSRKVVDYELSSTLEKEFVLTCLKRAFSHCKPELYGIRNI